MRITATILLLLPVLLGMPLLIGVYVWRDAGRRQMNAALWTLVAMLAPSFLGFVAYLLVRMGHSDLKCPQCSQPVTEDYAVCPHCGALLKPRCTHCGAAAEANWKVCPHCAQVLEETPYTAPVTREDRGLGKILAAVVAVPLVLLLVLYLLFQSTARVGAMNITYLTPESYLEAKADHWNEKEYEEVRLWLDSCLSDPNRAYVLRHNRIVEETPVIQYLVYYPAGVETSIEADHELGAFGTKLLVDFETGGSEENTNLCTISIYTERVPNLQIFIDGQKLAHTVTDVSYGLTLFEMIADP